MKELLPFWTLLRILHKKVKKKKKVLITSPPSFEMGIP
jgi:hypothetical protein